MRESSLKCSYPSCLNKPRRRGFCKKHRPIAPAKAGRPRQDTIDNTATYRKFQESVVEHNNFRDITKTTSERVRTLEDLIRVCEIDTAIWAVVEWHANKWEMGFKDAHEEGQVIPLFQVKARLRRKVEIIDARREIEALKALASQEINRAPNIIVRDNVTHGNMLEIDIFDLHLGKLAWAKETGHQNYDLAIATQLFREALETLIQRSSAFKFDQILFPVGQDFIHTDNLVTETAHGTRQDCDGRFHKSARIGRDLLIEAIERLRVLAPIVVPIVPGNHDQLTAWHLGDSLEAWFRNDHDVTINNLPTLRKYHEFGRNMLMFTHGNRGKRPNYPLLMAAEQPEMWGRTTYREAHTGHLHTTKVGKWWEPTLEEHGVRVRVLGSLCAADAWHAEMQFVGNLRTAEAFVWNTNEGIVQQNTFTV